ncbi:branched-chain amino acid ABC transporter substrate-binding protein [Bradyrhizobium sp. AS23.2]|nr:branched-chain amino acid ABC transporter substrate-binding protein [Bradyrhizobium sp. AS23.2]
MIRALVSVSLLVAMTAIVRAGDKMYGPGVTDAEIKIGNIAPYSGPASAYSLVAKTETAYFKMINENGGINGRKITFISYDDGYSPPKAVEQARKLVESDEVLALFGTIGTASNSAIQPYMNRRKVPQLFVGSGAQRFADPKRFPWTMGWAPNYQTEAAIYGQHIRSQDQPRKVAIIYQNDDFGRDFLAGLKKGLGEGAKTQLVAEVSFETSSPTIAATIVNLKASGADTLVIAAVTKFATQAIRSVAELGWKPAIYLTNVSIAVDNILKPAGLENAKGIISAAYRKDPADPAWNNDPGMQEFKAFMAKHLPGEGLNEQSVYGYLESQLLVRTIQQCGDNLTRENLMAQAANLKEVEFGLLLPGIKIDTSADDYSPIQQSQLTRFNGESWETFGPIMNEQ